MSRMEAVLRPQDLAALPPLARQIRPTGAMAAHLGRQYTVAELDDEDKIMEEDRRFLPLVRAYEVSPLLGATFTIRNAQEIGAALGRLLEEKLPGIGWQLKDQWLPAFAKYQLVHTSLAAPPDLATGQAMALEIYGQLWSVDGMLLNTPEGRAWLMRQGQARALSSDIRN